MGSSMRRVSDTAMAPVAPNALERREMPATPEPAPTEPCRKAFRAPVSPHDLIQEHYVGTPWAAWKMLVCNIALNCANRKQLDKVIGPFFERWPGPHRLLSSPVEDIAAAIKSLGFQNRRAERLLKLSEEYLACAQDDPDYVPTVEEVVDFYGVGSYAVFSHAMFCLGVLGDTPPDDGSLEKYWSWAKGEGAAAYARGWE